MASMMLLTRSTAGFSCLAEERVLNQVPGTDMLMFRSKTKSGIISMLTFGIDSTICFVGCQVRVPQKSKVNYS